MKIQNKQALENQNKQALNKAWNNLKASAGRITPAQRLAITTAIFEYRSGIKGENETVKKLERIKDEVVNSKNNMVGIMPSVEKLMRTDPFEFEKVEVPKSIAYGGREVESNGTAGIELNISMYNTVTSRHRAHE